MPVRLRIATFNLENWDETSAGTRPTLDERVALMRPQLLRLDADILCLQEVHSQADQAGAQLRALNRLLADTPYAGFHRVVTTDPTSQRFFPERNLVILSRFAVLDQQQIRHHPQDAPSYRPVTALPRPPQAETVVWERPLLYARLALGANRSLHQICVHLKSKIPSDVDGQKDDRFTWRTASGYAEGAFISSMKRLGQALQLRRFIDTLFDQDENALITVCGDFNADADEVPLEAIRGDVENTNNRELAKRVIVPCERTVPESSRYSLLHRGKGTMLDHILASRPLLTFYQGTQIHNEILHDKSIAFATNDKFPESDHAPVVAEFVLPD